MDLLDAGEYYQKWVLLALKKQELLESNKDKGRGMYHPPFLYEQELLRFDCSAMAVLGMTEEVLKDQIQKLIDNKLIQKIDTNEINHKYINTVQGNITVLQFYGRLMKPDEILNCKIPENGSGVLRGFKSKVVSHMEKHMPLITITRSIVEDILISYELYVELRRALYS